MTIHEHHLEELYRSGLTDTTIEKAGIRSVNSAEIATVLGWKPKHFDFGDGLLFPFNGTGFAQVKPDFPRAGENGKVRKYESPKGKHVEAYLPLGFGEQIQTAKVIVVTEGVKKCLALSQQGYCTVGLTGVWGFQQPRQKTDTGRTYGERKLIPALEEIDWAGKVVVIVFDSDAAENHMVQLAEWRLAEVLQGKKATVKIVRLPAGNDGTKVGVDDFLVARGEAGPAELQRLIDEAKPAECPPRPDEMEWARMYLDDQWRHSEGLTLRWHRDQFNAWDGKRYREFPDSELSAIVTEWLADRQVETKSRFVSEIMHALRALCRVPFTIEPPAWIGDGDTSTMAVENGIVDLDALLAGKDTVIRRHTPRWFSPVCLPYRFDPEADCPSFLSFLNTVMAGDEDRIAMLQEWSGYLLLPDTSQHKYLLACGEGANGKSVYFTVTEAMLGTDNVSHVGLELFGGRFQLCTTIGKLANIITEVGEPDKMAEGVFKAFVAGDMLQYDRKNREPIQTKPTARVMIATNTKPRWVDRSEGIWRRTILVPFSVAIPEDKQDKGLAQRIIDTELPGVLCWAIAGLHRLRQQGGFTHSSVCDEALAEYRCEVNPARSFFDEYCEALAGSTIKCRDLYRLYVGWCTDRGYRPLADRGFGVEVRRVFNVERFQQQENKVREWCYTGIRCTAPDYAARSAPTALTAPSIPTRT